MASGRLVLLRYATALHELAVGAGAVDAIGEQLDALAHNVGSHADLQRQLGSPRLTRERKRKLLLSLLGDGAHDLVRRTVMLLVDKGRAEAAPALAAVYGEVAMAAAGRVAARVESAQALDEPTRTRLAAQLRLVTGKTVTLEESLAEDLLGGFRVVIGSRMIDGSLRRRLEQMQDKLIHAPLAAAD